MLRKMLMVGLAFMLFVVIGGCLLLFPPLPIPPEIARGLPSRFSEADEEFGRRVLAEFPLPITLPELTARLDEQGFAVDVDNNYAIFEKAQFPCTLIWRVYWEVVDGSVTDLSSKYGGSCL